MSGRRPQLLTGMLALAVVVAGALIWKAYGPADTPLPEPVAEATDAEEGPLLDLERLNERDLAFLQETLREGTPAAQRSAAKALIIAERLEGAPMLFEAAARGGADALTFCLAGLEILRVQRAEHALRELLLAIRRGGELPEGCRVELADRFGLVSRGQEKAVLALASDPDPEVRAWAAEAAARGEVPGADAVLLRLVSDPSTLVRRSAWLALLERPVDQADPQLVRAYEAERDPRNLEIVRELGLR